MSVIRKFEGKNYAYKSFAFTKKRAREVAKEWRSKGYYVRVPYIGHKDVYHIYVRRKK